MKFYLNLKRVTERDAPIDLDTSKCPIQDIDCMIVCNHLIYIYQVIPISEASFY